MSKKIDLAPNASPRLLDVAREAGVSRAAVARVLLGTGAGRVRVSEETGERIRRAAESLGYRPNRLARQLKGGASGMLGVLLDTDNPDVMNDRLFAIEEAAAERDYRLLIGRVRGSAALLKEYLSDFQDRNVDGMICLFDLTPVRTRILRGVSRVRFPLVFHGRSPIPAGRAVRVDTECGVELLWAHLRGRGRKRVALALANRADALVTLRLKAFRRAHELAGLSIPGKRVWTGGGSMLDAGDVREAVNQLVVSAGADAVMATDDLMALLLIQEIKRRGFRVPEDVAVTGYDNLQWGALMEPSLTTIDQEHDRYAAAIFDLLGSGERGGPDQVVITPRLVMRKSG